MSVYNTILPMIEVFIDIPHCELTSIESQFVLFIDVVAFRNFAFHVPFNDEPDAPYPG